MSPLWLKYSEDVRFDPDVRLGPLCLAWHREPPAQTATVLHKVSFNCNLSREMCMVECAQDRDSDHGSEAKPEQLCIPANQLGKPEVVTSSHFRHAV